VRDVVGQSRPAIALGPLPLFGGSLEEGKGLSTGFACWQSVLIEVSRPDRLILSVSEALVHTRDIEIGRLEMRHCHELFPVTASYFLSGLLSRWDHDRFSKICFVAGRIPLSARAPASVSRYP